MCSRFSGGAPPPPPAQPSHLPTWTSTSSASIVSPTIAVLPSIFLEAPPKTLTTALKKNTSCGRIKPEMELYCKSGLLLAKTHLAPLCQSALTNHCWAIRARSRTRKHCFTAGSLVHSCTDWSSRVAAQCVCLSIRSVKGPPAPNREWDKRFSSAAVASP